MGGPGFSHNYIVSKLIDTIPGLMTQRFGNSLRKLGFDLPPVRFVPDAYKISHNENGKLLIDLYEVEIGNKIDDYKMECIVRWYEDMDHQELFYCQIHLIDRFEDVIKIVTDEKLRSMAEYLRMKPILEEYNKIMAVK
jgi:hypothetical protein